MSLLERPALDADPVATASELRLVLGEQAADVERLRRLPETHIELLAERGLLTLTLPRRFGGTECDLRTVIKTCAALGEGCGSTAWVATNFNLCSWLGALFGDRAQQDVWGGDPNARLAGSLSSEARARRVEGGVVLDGRWGFVSGCQHAQWAVLAAAAYSTEHPDDIMALVPIADLQIDETWFTAGLEGTGSNTLVANGVFVPGHRTQSLAAVIEGVTATEHSDEVLYRSALVPTLCAMLLGPLIGEARAGLRLVIEHADRGRVPMTNYRHPAESSTFRIQVARAACRIDTATLHIGRATDVLMRFAAEGAFPDRLDRARTRADTAVAGNALCDAVNELMSAEGAMGFASANALQRIWRDINFAARGRFTNPSVSEESYGTALLGLESTVTTLI